MVVNIIIQTQNWKHYKKVVLEGWDIYTQHKSDLKLNRDVLSSTGIAI